LLSFSTAIAADTKKEMTPEQQEMMKKFMEYSTPGEQHKMLATYAGNWTYTQKMWEKPDSKPEESTGKSTMRMILDGKWLEQTIDGTAMGMPFKGLGYTGYNNVTKQYETIFLDSMGTGSMHGLGSYDAKTKTLKDQGEYTCPLSADKKREYRSEWKFNDKNTMTFVMYGPGVKDEKEFKQMEIVYKRVK
jgi:hypothetical protein